MISKRPKMTRCLICSPVDSKSDDLCKCVPLVSGVTTYERCTDMLTKIGKYLYSTLKDADTKEKCYKIAQIWMEPLGTRMVSHAIYPSILAHYVTQLKLKLSAIDPKNEAFVKKVDEMLSMFEIENSQNLYMHTMYSLQLYRDTLTDRIESENAKQAIELLVRD